MDFLSKLFGKKQSKGRSQKHTYQPGQREPGEYHELYALTTKKYSEASEPKMTAIVGFDDQNALENSLDALGGQLSGVVCEHRSFAARNPVAIIEYPATMSVSIEEEKAMINDARLLHSNGASDISVVGISMVAAEQLRGLFGHLSCVHLAIAKKK